MKKFLILLCFLPILTFAQKNEKATFPESWQGKYAGDLKIYAANQVRQSIYMEIHILQSDSSENYQWTIIYKGDEKEDIRNYELLTIDPEMGHFQIDEKNSIVLDAYLFENTLTSRFEVNASLLLVNYSMSPDKEILSFDIFWGDTKNRRETGLEDQKNTIYSYPVLTRQHATLYRKP